MAGRLISRRGVLACLGAAAGTAVLAACQQQPQVVEKVVEKPVERVVTQVVEKPVEKVVERQVVVTATPGQQAAAPAKVTLRLQNWFNQEDMWAWNIGLNAFRAKYPNIDLKLEFNPYGETIPKVIAHATAGTMPDVVMASNEHTPTFIANGLLRDLNAFIQRDRDVKPEDYWEGVSQGFNMYGRWWGFPYDCSTFALYYNKEMLDAAGVPYPPGEGKTPWTLEQFLDAARKLTNPAKGQWGVLITPNSQYEESNLVYTFGGRNFSDDLKKSLWDSDEVAQAIQFRLDLIHKHKVAPPLAEIENQNVNYFVAKKAAMVINGQWAIIGYNNQAPFDFDVGYHPTGKTKRLVTGGSGFTIGATSKFPDESWAFVKDYLGTETLADMIGATGRGIPGRKSSTPAFVKAGAGGRPKHRNVHTDQLEWAFNDRSVLAYYEIIAARWRELEPLYRTGQGNVRESAAKMAKVANELLDREWSKAKIS